LAYGASDRQRTGPARRGVEYQLRPGYLECFPLRPQGQSRCLFGFIRRCGSQSIISGTGLQAASKATIGFDQARKERTVQHGLACPAALFVWREPRLQHSLYRLWHGGGSGSIDSAGCRQIQSMIFAGDIAPPKSNPHEIAIETMNNIFGGTFTSRINMNLREGKHWSYGVHSILASARGQRPFIVIAPVQTDKTKESVVEIN